MKQGNTLFVVAAAMLGLFAIVPSVNAAPPHGAPVVIQNNTNDPVPVTGNVAATITNVPGVVVNNTSTNPVPVQVINGAGETPIQFTLCIWCPFPESYDVPIGKRLLIERVDIFNSIAAAPDLSSQSLLTYRYETTAGSTIASPHYIKMIDPLRDAPLSMTTNLAYSENTRVYADPGTTVKVYFAGYVNVSLPVWTQFTFSGVLIPAP